MAEAMKTPLEVARDKFDVALKDANAALEKNPVDMTAYSAAIAALDEAEKQYAKLAAEAKYAEFTTKDNPIVEIIKARTYTILGHKETRGGTKENPRVMSVDMVEKSRDIDLLAFCEKAKLDTNWAFVASRVNQLMCLRAATQLGADVKKIATSYFLRDKVKEINLGKTPTSNTQVCKLLQTVIDEIMPSDMTEGGVAYKVNSHDVAYLDDLYGKKSGKHDLTVRVSNDSFFRRILVDICYRLVTNGKYGVDGYKGYKDEA